MARRIRTPPASGAKPRYRVANWRDYNRALVGRGSIALWIDEEVLANWRATEGKGRPYSDAAILCALSLRAVFGLALRQTQGFLLSLKQVLGLTIDIPNNSTFCRRAAGLAVRELARPAGNGPLHLAFDSTGLKVHGEGEWKVRMHGKGKRRVWRKLHLGQRHKILPSHQMILRSELRLPIPEPGCKIGCRRRRHTPEPGPAAHRRDQHRHMLAPGRPGNAARVAMRVQHHLELNPGPLIEPAPMDD